MRAPSPQPIRPHSPNPTHQGNGKVVVAGAATATSTGVTAMLATRFLHEANSSGQIVDSSFDSGRRAIVAFAGPAAAYAVAVSNTGDIYLAMIPLNVPGQPANAVG